MELTTTLATIGRPTFRCFRRLREWRRRAGAVDAVADAVPFLAKGGVGELLANWGADALRDFGFDEAEGSATPSPRPATGDAAPRHLRR